MISHASAPLSTATPTSCWLGRFCLGLMEAAWLAAATVVPLLFDPNQLGGFEPAKAGMLRIVGVIIGAAWLLFAIASRMGLTERPPGGTGAKAFAIAVTLLAAANVVATIYSISPMESLWGAREYLQGAATTMAGLLIATSVGVHLRTKAQIHRLVTAILLASVPMALYALVQSAGRDPVNFGLVGRTASLTGHPIYLGDYLCMVLPVALWKVAQAWRWPAKGARIAGTILYSVIALLQLMAFVSSGSRGPLYGLAVALAVVGVGYCALFRRWRWLATGAAVASVALCFFLSLNFRYSPALRLASALHIARYADAMNFRGTDGFRTAHWREAARFLVAPVRVEYPVGGADPWHLGRRLFGYGPETLQHILPQRLTWPSREINVEDRFHNTLWDLWYSLGFFGVGAFLIFIVVLLHHGFVSAGLLGRAHLRAWGTTLVVGAGIGVGAAAMFGLAFAALGLIAGLAASVIVWPLICQCWCRRGETIPAQPANDLATLAIALLAGIIGGLMAESFAFPVGSTLVLFWLCAGMLAASYRDLESTPEPHESLTTGEASRAPFLPGVNSHLASGVYVGSLILLTLLFAFLHEYSVDAQTIGSVLASTLLKNGGLLLWIILLPVVFVSIGAALLEVLASGKGIRAKAVLAAFGLLATIATGYAVISAFHMICIGSFPSAAAPPGVAVHQAIGYQWFSLLYVVAIVLLMAVWALSLAGLSMRGDRARPYTIAGALLALVLAIGAGAWYSSLRFLRPSITAQWGTVLGSHERPEAAASVLREAVAEQPNSIFCHTLLANELVNQALHTAPQINFERLMGEAETALLPALSKTHGLNAVPFHLGRCYLLWAADSPTAEKRKSLAEKSATAFDRALRIEPNQPMTWLDSALALELLLAQPEEAARRRNRARELYAKDQASVCAESLRARCLEMRSPILQNAYADEALYYFTRASETAKEPAERGMALMNEGNWRLTLGDLGGAGRAFLAALPLLPKEAWRIHLALSEIAGRQGNRQGALQDLVLAIDLAPPEEKAPLLEARRRLFGP